MIRIGLALGGLQLAMILLCWLVSPSAWLAGLGCALWLGVLVLVTWHRQWLGGLDGWWRRWLGLIIWQLPGLGAGLASCALLAQWWRGPAIVVFILQAWLQPLAPLLRCAPQGPWGGVAPYLWLAALAPAAQVLALGLLSTVLTSRPGSGRTASQP
jgi:hypothetical protein